MAHITFLLDSAASVTVVLTVNWFCHSCLILRYEILQVLYLQNAGTNTLSSFFTGLLWRFNLILEWIWLCFVQISPVGTYSPSCPSVGCYWVIAESLFRNCLQLNCCFRWVCKMQMAHPISSTGRARDHWMVHEQMVQTSMPRLWLHLLQLTAIPVAPWNLRYP